MIGYVTSDVTRLHLYLLTHQFWVHLHGFRRESSASISSFPKNFAKRIIKLLPMANFMDLPREIRDVIYVFDLVKPDKVFIPKKFVKFRPQWLQKPTVPLLYISENIHAEAIQIFYCQNMFELPRSPDITSRSVFKEYAPLLRHIVVRFSLYDIPGMSAACLDDEYADYGTNRPTFKPDSIISRSCRQLWSKKQSLLLPMKNLKSVYFTTDSFLRITIRPWQLRMLQREQLVLVNYANWLLPILRECFKPLVDGAKGRAGGGLELSGSIFCFNEEAHKIILERVWESLGVVYDVKDLKKKTSAAYERFGRE